MSRLRLALILLSAAMTSLEGQTLKGTILGDVSDTSGAVIPAVQVVVIETGTQAVTVFERVPSEKPNPPGAP